MDGTVLKGRAKEGAPGVSRRCVTQSALTPHYKHQPRGLAPLSCAFQTAINL